METRRLHFLSGNGLGAQSDLNQGFSVGTGRLHGWGVADTEGREGLEARAGGHSVRSGVQGVRAEVVAGG